MDTSRSAAIPGHEKTPIKLASIQPSGTALWKMVDPILKSLQEKPVRLGQMKRAIPGVSTKVLNQSLQNFIRAGIVERRDLSANIKRVEYSLTEQKGMTVSRFLDTVTLLEAEANWWIENGNAAGMTPRLDRAETEP